MASKVYNIIFCLLLCQFCKKVVLQLNEHGDVTETQIFVQCFLANFRDRQGILWNGM